MSKKGVRLLNAHFYKILKLEKMETIRISKTIYPEGSTNNFNEWAKWMWAQYKIEIDKTKKGWEKNIYTPKK